LFIIPDRHSRLRKAHLIEQYGLDIALRGLGNEVAKWERMGIMRDECGACDMTLALKT